MTLPALQAGGYNGNVGRWAANGLLLAREDRAVRRRSWWVDLAGGWLVIGIVMAPSSVGPTAQAAERRPVPKEHPRLLGSKAELQELARQRPEAYARMARVARQAGADDHAKMMSVALVAAIEDDAALARQAIQLARKYFEGPIRKGHVTFGHDLALCAVGYDLCYPWWTEADKTRFHRYMNDTVDANVDSETHVFHNGWYGYKNWGIGLACYATYYENPRAGEILQSLYEDYRQRAAPALELAGEGGGWAEGYYIHYWLYEWLVFCEAARRCEGVDYYALAPKFYSQRAIASAFEMYPGIRQYGSRRPMPMGDGGGRLFGGERDKALSARRILVNYYRDDPLHQMVHAFNELTPRSSVGEYAYKDFLWRDTTVPQRDLKSMKLSHLSRGPGYVYARSSWDEDATVLLFKCGDRFTAHQHLDVGHFLIFKHEELVGDGGHYDDFGSLHDVNYHLRSIAHNTMLVYDPAEVFKNIRAGPVSGNDGGQAHNWPHHNGAVADPQQWHKQRELYDIADLLAYADRGAWMYIAGDCTRAYSPAKLRRFTRQIVYIRPGTFVVFDRVSATRPELKKTWLLQAMKKPVELSAGRPPEESASNPAGRLLYRIDNGKGRLYLQTLLPQEHEVRLVSGAELYSYGGKSYPPRRDTGPAPECRVQVTPRHPAADDYFLHVLKATDTSDVAAPQAAVRLTDREAVVSVDGWRIGFGLAELFGWIEHDGRREPLPHQ